jgi:hypothetical protein
MFPASKRFYTYNFEALGQTLASVRETGFFQCANLPLTVSPILIVRAGPNPGLRMQD